MKLYRLLFCILAMGTARPCAAAPPPMRFLDRVEGDYLCGIRAGAAAGEVESLFAGAGCAVEEIAPGATLHRIRTPKGLRLEEFVYRRRTGGASPIEYIEPNYLVKAQAVPNDSRFGELYALLNRGTDGGVEGADIRASQAWEIATGGGVVVAVIDSGIDCRHPDLAPNIWRNDGEIPGNGVDDDGNGYIDDLLGWDFANGDPDPDDDYGHGTHCAGIIAAAGDNGIGVAGVCWRARIVPLKFLGASGYGTIADAVAAIHYARRCGARVINASWGGPSRSRALEEAILAAQAEGIVVIAAAGNGGSDNDQTRFYPAGYDCPNLVAVAATDRRDLLAPFSCYGGSSVHLGAPGDAILSTVPGGGYAVKSGTSMAAPHAAGAAALLLARDPSLGCTEVVAALLGGTTPLPSLAGRVRSGGRLNLLKVLDPSSDGSPPDPVTDLRAAGGGPGTVVLRWSVPEDTDGAVVRYRIGCSTNPLDETAGWNAERWDYLRSAAASGAEEEFAVEGLERGVAYHFEIVAYDRCGNPSPPSNTASARTGCEDPAAHRVSFLVEEEAGSIRLFASLEPGARSPHHACDAYVAVSVSGGPLLFFGDRKGHEGSLIPFAKGFEVSNGTVLIGTARKPVPKEGCDYRVFGVLVPKAVSPLDSSRWASNLACVSYEAHPPQ
ncbi:MAG: S8 family serine peptidase [Chlamydiae bacterium]|nr:S8 family serine peptidase [Chlamydiota bacterium]